jgi:hypothetical protein
VIVVSAYIELHLVIDDESRSREELGVTRRSHNGELSQWGEDRRSGQLEEKTYTRPALYPAENARE